MFSLSLFTLFPLKVDGSNLQVACFLALCRHLMRTLYNISNNWLQEKELLIKHFFNAHTLLEFTQSIALYKIFIRTIAKYNKWNDMCREKNTEKNSEFQMRIKPTTNSVH